MRLQSFELKYIKSFRNLKFDFDRTAVLVGQNDHGKSSILKAFDIVLNQLDEVAVASGALHPDLAERLLPIFPVNSKACRITLNYKEGAKEKQLYVTVRADLTFVVHDEVIRNPKTTDASIQILKTLRANNKFTLIPALRDAASDHFQELFARILHEHGISKMVPKKAGGTPKEYRTLKDIRDQITQKIKPYINDTCCRNYTSFWVWHAAPFNAQV